MTMSRPGTNPVPDPNPKSYNKAASAPEQNCPISDSFVQVSVYNILIYSEVSVLV